MSRGVAENAESVRFLAQISAAARLRVISSQTHEGTGIYSFDDTQNSRWRSNRVVEFG